MKKKTRKKVLWGVVVLGGLFVLGGVLMFFLGYQPAYYKPLVYADKQRVPKYLTHVLGPAIHNGLQKGDAFDVVITEDGINEIIAWSEWPKKESEISFLQPQVYFLDGRIAVAGTVLVRGAEIVITAMGEPVFEEEGQLVLRFVGVWAGKVNVGPVAKLVAKRIYAQRTAEKEVRDDDIGVKVARSLIFGEAFEPVFEIKGLYEDDLQVRILGAEVGEKRLTMRLIGAEL